MISRAMLSNRPRCCLARLVHLISHSGCRLATKSIITSGLRIYCISCAATRTLCKIHLARKAKLGDRHQSRNPFAGIDSSSPAVDNPLFKDWLRQNKVTIAPSSELSSAYLHQPSLKRRQHPHSWAPHIAVELPVRLASDILLVAAPVLLVVCPAVPRHNAFLLQSHVTCQSELSGPGN